jgi:hypothetical protein
MVHSLTWKLLSSKFKKMPSLRANDNNDDGVDGVINNAAQQNDGAKPHENLEEEDAVIDSQLTVKTDNTSKGTEDDEDVIDSKVLTDNNSKGIEEEEKQGHDRDMVEEQTKIKDVELLGAPDQEKASDINNKETEEEEECEQLHSASSSPKFDTAREYSNDSFPNSSQMLTPLEPLMSQELETATTSPQKMTQQQQQQLHTQATTATTATTSLLQTQMTHDGQSPSICNTQGTSFLTTQMTQEQQQQKDDNDDEEEEEEQLNTQGTTVSSLDLQLGVTQESQKDDAAGGGRPSDDIENNEKSPALFEDAKDKDFVETFVTKMNDSSAADGGGGGVAGNKEDKMEEEGDDMSLDEGGEGDINDNPKIGKDSDEAKDMFFETNDGSDDENYVDNDGVGLLTQAVHDDDDDESMSDVNSVRTQESEGDKPSSDDNCDIKKATTTATSAEDNEVVVDAIEEKDIIIKVESGNDDNREHLLSGLTGPSQSQADVPDHHQQTILSQRSIGSKHVSFQQDSQAYKEVDVEGNSNGEKNEKNDDDIAEKQNDLEPTSTEQLEEEKGDDEKDAASEPKDSSDRNDEKENVLAAADKESSTTAEVAKEKSQASQALDDEIVDEDMPEQTGDTIVTTGSASIGWSLYDGETQQLLTGPSQIHTSPSKVAKDSDLAANEGKEEEGGDDFEITDEPTPDANDDDVEMKLDEDDETDDGYNEQTQPLDKPNSGDDATKTNVEKRKHDDDDDDSLVDMQHTQENGLSSALSYPNDHIEKEQSPVKAATLYHTQNETQQSQDLLALTPLKENSDSHMKSPTTQQKEDNDNDDVKATSDKVLGSAISKPKPIVQQKSSPMKAASPKKADSKWISRNREEASPEGPRLVFPSFKGAEKSIGNEHKDEASDDEAWVGGGLQSDHPCDDIEDTQDDYLQQKPKEVSFKRLSAKRSRSPSIDSSTADEAEVEDPDDTFVPKVLRYGGDRTKKNEPCDTRSQSSSEAEFNEDNGDDDDDDDCDDNDYDGSGIGHTAAAFPLSQTDEAIKRQLREIQEMALPSTKQLKEIASRKRMSDQITAMRERHEEEINALKRENAKLRNALKKKDDIINENECKLAEKNKLLTDQAAVMTMLKKKLDIVNETSMEEPASVEKPKSTKKRTPASKSSKKRKQSEEEDAYSSESDDDALPLSALKNNPGKKNSAVKAQQARQSSGSSSKSVPPKPTKAKAGGNSSAKVKASSTKKSAPAVSALSNDKYWKILVEKGWTYKTGPEPYNKVYVPKDGATHMGCQSGIHFFTDLDQVITEAIKRGDLEGDEPAQALASNQDVTPKATNQSKTQSNNEMDDTKLYGLVTLETARFAVDLVGRFVRGQDSAATFRGHLFDPLWQRLKEQGAEAGNNWKYEPYSSALSLYSWCFVPPTSASGNKGKLGEDYYVKEEHLVLGVLQSVVSLKEISGLMRKKQSTFSTVLGTLTRAVDNDMSYEDARDGKNPSVRSRRARVIGSPETSSKKTKSSRKSSPRRQTKVSSTAEAALSSSKKKSAATKKTPDKKRARTVSPNTGSGNKKKQKVEVPEHVSPSFHMDQTQTQVAVPTYERRSPSSASGPLSGFTFMCSGVNKSVNDRIKKLGGEIVGIESLNRSKAYKKLFFLSDQQGWRKPKYVFAAALGAPMLHIDWLAQIEEKYEEEGEVSVFDSSLYTRYRLPTGLDLFHRAYTLQRASHARDWVQPGGRDGGIFEGMTIALALGKEEQVW